MRRGDDDDRGRWLVLILLIGAVVLVLGFVVWPWVSDSDEEPTLHELVRDCDVEAASARIAETGSPGTGDDLVRAVDCGAPMVGEMLEAGASPNSDDAETGETALAAAADRAPLDVVELLLEHGADATRVSRDDETALHQAAGRGNRDIIEALLDAGADIEARTDNGWTPLMLADDAQTVDLLIDAGADPNAQSDAGDSALLNAANGGDSSIAAALLGGGADPNLPTNRGHTPVFRAVSYGHAAVLRQLLDAGASPEADAEVTIGDIGFVWVARSGDLTFDDLDRTIAVLGPTLGLDESIVDAAEGDGLLETLGSDTSPLSDLDMGETVGVFTPLYLAAVFGDEEMTQLLLDAGADPSIGTQPTGHLPREAAEALGYSDVAELLTQP